MVFWLRKKILWFFIPMVFSGRRSRKFLGIFSVFVVFWCYFDDVLGPYSDHFCIRIHFESLALEVAAYREVHKKPVKKKCLVFFNTKINILMKSAIFPGK